MLAKILIEPWPWYVAGPAVGLYVLAFLYFKDKPLGASSTYQATLEALQGKGDPKHLDLKVSKADLPVDPRENAPRWRVWFLAGLLLGGALGLAGGGEGTGTAHLPGFLEFFRVGAFQAGLILFTGGMLIGAGTRMSGGCTSGHAITGISNMQLPSLLATATFLAVGMATTFGIRAWLG